MYGANVPTSVAAGVPGVVTPVAMTQDASHLMWFVLLVVTLVTLGLALARLVPKPQQ